MTDQPPRCGCCGTPNPDMRTNDGYTQCCNKRAVYPHEEERYADIKSRLS